MTDHKANGHEPVDLAHVDDYATHAEARLRAQLADLRAMLSDEDRVQEALRAKLDESKHRQSGLRRAIDALDPQPKNATKRGPGRPSTTERNSGSWHVSDKKIEQVLRALVEHGEPVSGNKLAESIDGLSSESVRRAFTVLREQGRIRIAGRAQGGGNLFAPMPEEVGELDESEISVLSKASGS